MTNDHDPRLETLFAISEQDLAEEAFTANVMSHIDRMRRRTAALWGGVALVLAICAWLISIPLLNAMSLVTQILPSTLVDLDNSWLAQVFAPINSIGGLVVLGLIGLRAAYRKIFM